MEENVHLVCFFFAINGPKIKNIQFILINRESSISLRSYNIFNIHCNIVYTAGGFVCLFLDPWQVSSISKDIVLAHMNERTVWVLTSVGWHNGEGFLGTAELHFFHRKWRAT